MNHNPAADDTTKSLSDTQHTPSPQPVPSKHSRAAWLAGAAFLAFYVALLHWNTLALPLIRDEGEYAYAAWLLDQGLLPYWASVLQKPPMVIYTYWLGLPFDDGSGVAFRWLAVIFQWLAALVLGEIAVKEIGPTARWPARFILPAFILMPNMAQAMANVEHFMLLPILLVWWLKAARSNNASLLDWALAGVLCAIAILYKFTAAPTLCLIFAAWLFDTWKQSPSPALHALLLKPLAALAGAFIAALLILSPFILHDGTRSFIECTILFNRQYVSSHLLNSKSLITLTNMATIWIPFWVIALVWLAKRPPGWPFYLLMFLAALISTASSPYTQYYLILLPVLAIISAGGVAMIQARLERKYNALRNASLRWVVPALAALLAVAPNLPWLLKPTANIATTLDWAAQFQDNGPIANAILTLTTPDDPILIAGSEPQILYMAKRRSSTRFSIVYPMMLPTTFAEPNQKLAIQEITQNPPKLIIIVREAASWLRSDETPAYFSQHLQPILDKDYTFVATYYDNQGAMTWVTQPAAATATGSKWVLFLRRDSHPG